MKVIIDTDPGHDDALALMLALRSPELEVLAITTVAGNSTVENCTRNARYILGILDSKVPVFSGTDKPISRELIQAVVHGKSGLDGIDPMGDPKLTGDAADKIIELVENNPDEITLITLGPLTNVAKAIQTNPKTMSKARQIVSMGGAISAAGNKNRVAEFNIFVDPEAADIVFRSGIPLTLVPLDACNHVQLSLSDFESINDIKLKSVILKMVRPYIKNLTKDAGYEGAMMYDPLTVYYLLDPGSCRTAEFNIQVETKGELTRGMTVTDRRPVPDKLPPNVTVVLDIDGSKFTKRFLASLS